MTSLKEIVSLVTELENSVNTAVIC